MMESMWILLTAAESVNGSAKQKTTNLQSGEN